MGDEREAIKGVVEWLMKLICRSPSATLSFHFILLFLMGRMIEMKCAAALAAQENEWMSGVNGFILAEERREPTKKNKIILFLFEERKSEVGLLCWIRCRRRLWAAGRHGLRQREANAKKQTNHQAKRVKSTNHSLNWLEWWMNEVNEERQSMESGLVDWTGLQALAR